MQASALPQLPQNQPASAHSAPCSTSGRNFLDCQLEVMQVSGPSICSSSLARQLMVHLHPTLPFEEGHMACQLKRPQRLQDFTSPSTDQQSAHQLPCITFVQQHMHRRLTWEAPASAAIWVWTCWRLLAGPPTH